MIFIEYIYINMTVHRERNVARGDSLFESWKMNALLLVTLTRFQTIETI